MTPKVQPMMTLSKAAAPYLHALICENHQITPVVPISLTKDNIQWIFSEILKQSDMRDGPVVQELWWLHRDTNRTQ